MRVERVHYTHIVSGCVKEAATMVLLLVNVLVCLLEPLVYFSSLLIDAPVRDKHREVSSTLSKIYT
jgi:hypothetical protein